MKTGAVLSISIVREDVPDECPEASIAVTEISYVPSASSHPFVKGYFDALCSFKTQDHVPLTESTVAATVFEEPVEVFFTTRVIPATPISSLQDPPIVNVS